jgi:hypothetical protein
MAKTQMMTLRDVPPTEVPPKIGKSEKRKRSAVKINRFLVVLYRPTSSRGMRFFSSDARMCVKYARMRFIPPMSRP